MLAVVTQKVQNVFHVAAWSKLVLLLSHIEKKKCLRPVVPRPESAEKSSLDVPDNTIWSAWKERRWYPSKEHLFTKYFYNLEPDLGFKVHQISAEVTGNVCDGGTGNVCGAQMREIRIGMAGDSVLCWGVWWDTTCSIIVCLVMCFMRYVSWEEGKKTTTKEEISTWAHTFAAAQILNIRLPAHRGVRPAAEAAAVGLGVLDGVCRKVDLQGGRVRVGTVTVGTFEGFVFVVLPLVRLEQRIENRKSAPVHESPQKLWESS